jgi:hypothetical protein
MAGQAETHGGRAWGARPVRPRPPRRAAGPRATVSDVAAGHRRVRMQPRPALTIVFATRATLPGARFRARLSEVVTRACNAEVVVAFPDGRLVPELRQRFPAVRFLTCAVDASLGELRSAGMRAAEGDVVALVDDDCDDLAGRLQALDRWRRP